MTNQKLKTFQPEAIEKIAKLIGNLYTGSEITTLFARSGYPEIVHGGATKWRFVAVVLTQLQEESGGSPNHILRVLQAVASPQAWINNREGYESVLKHINDILEFYGLKITDEGALKTIGEAVKTVRRTKSEDELLFDQRCFHPQVIKHARHHFCKGAYFHSVFECCKAFDTAVKRNSGIDESGQKLMGSAFKLDGPIKLNSQSSQSERDEQEGVKFLCMGLMNAIRNPQAHEPELDWPMAREDALDVLAMISFLFRKLGRALIVRDGRSGEQVLL